ncbi:MAG TPA: hypothetical protein PK951_09865, partial [Chitinophagaceae bacterium]|nr:hypothetical protein [Chitinophagaceae bacterium]
MKRLTYAALALVFFSCNTSDSSNESQPRDVKQYTIEQFYKSTQVGGGFLSSDDSKLLVSSNESGIYNAYEIDIASGDKKVLTTSTKESVFANSYVPGSASFI